MKKNWLHPLLVGVTGVTLLAGAWWLSSSQSGLAGMSLLPAPDKLQELQTQAWREGDVRHHVQAFQQWREPVNAGLDKDGRRLSASLDGPQTLNAAPWAMSPLTGVQVLVASPIKGEVQSAASWRYLLSADQQDVSLTVEPAPRTPLNDADLFSVQEYTIYRLVRDGRLLTVVGKLPAERLQQIMAAFQPKRG